MTVRAALRTVAAALLFAAAPIDAQDPLDLDVADAVPRLIVQGVLDDDALEDAVRSGLPLRMQFRLELWRDGIIDDLTEQAAWSAVIAFEPLEGRFLAGTLPADSLGAHPSWEAARSAIEGAYVPEIGPSAAGRYYYIAQVEIETLSLSDLDELERWLRGALEPAVRGRRSVGGAIGTGLKRLLIRILGLPARRYEVRSEPFTFP